VEPSKNNLLSSCPICESSRLENFLNVKDNFLSKENFSISSCLNCGLKFTNPRPKDDNLSEYYQSEKYYSHSKKKNGFIPWLYQIIKRKNISTKYQQIVPKGQTGRILDIGCGTGDFLLYCKEKSWIISGVEPDKGARKIAETLLEQEIYSANETDQWADSTFDIITMWHVLEHVSDLNQQFIELQRLIKEDGKLILALPNFKSYDALYYKENWAAWDVPRHLYHFNKQVISQIASNYGFKLLESLPMKWDSYYVSLLSEQSKGSVLSILRASIIGFVSNRKASKSGEFSSKIYIFIKK
jgi:2-polyprenyl-3-methyl-5-hydroxy-6-metoxy-1,4-benzoquinol methylase